MEGEREETGFRRRHALLSGGGSGGHVFPALAVAEELRREGWSVTFAGDPRGLEGRLVTRAGFSLLELPARPWVGRGLRDRWTAAKQLLHGALRARRAVLRAGVDVTLATGGYASVAGALGTCLARRPLVLLEPNQVSGVANRFLSRLAREACVAAPGAGQGLRCPRVATGVPIRGGFPPVPPPLPWEPPVVLVLGGSQGARQLNELVPAALETIADRVEGLHVIHQAGVKEEEWVRRRMESSRWPAGMRWEVHGFLEDVPGRLLGATLVVSRSGAVTLAEISAAGRPALLVPLALAGGHQQENARRYARQGAAVVLEDRPLEAPALGKALAELLARPDRLESMARASHALARLDAARAVAARLEAAIVSRERAA